MDITKIKHNKVFPDSFYSVIEIAAGHSAVKYEFDKASGGLFVDRFMQTSMRYPCHYGFVPNTLSGDGDPLDVLVYTNYDIIPGSVIEVRPIGVLMTEDEGGRDEKILSVPTSKIDPSLSNIASYEQLSSLLLDKIKHFFEHYKDLEQGKWVKVEGFKDAAEAKRLLQACLQNAH